MAQPLSQSVTRNYYFGGLAEFVSHPTPLTFSFFEHWFRGDTSLGRALSLLGLPYTPSSLSVLDIQQNTSVVDLKNEETTLYGNTIFQYKNHIDPNVSPSLMINPIFVLYPLRLFNTGKILYAQSKWIAFPQKSVAFAESCIQSIPEKKEYLSIREIDEELTTNVWPNVLAVGMLCEFYDHLLHSEERGQYLLIQRMIGELIKDRDWFFRSLTDQKDVQSGKLSLSEFLDTYGFRADNDYELTEPRWYEIPDTMQKRTVNVKPTHEPQNATPKLKPKQKILVDTVVELLILRSTAKRKALLFIDQLRKHILRIVPDKNELPYVTRNELLTGSYQNTSHRNQTLQPIEAHLSTKRSGKGTGVSQGVIQGNTMFIHSIHTKIPSSTIGIFPNASPEFSMKYPECKGIIFLRGGLTSHGSIVAREYGIPAIIAPDTEGIPDNCTMRIHGESGEWTVL